MRPKVLIPYPGPDPDPANIDVFVYLRPESNGVAVESTILSAVRDCPECSGHISFLYLANVPGTYIVERGIVERHYGSRLYFAVHGGRAFSADMRRQFEAAFGEPFPVERVVGAFAVLEHRRISAEELFRLWVPEHDMARIAGQTIKKNGDHYIVNYDIPALLHKNNAGTDIAVMLFRTNLAYERVFALVDQIRAALVKKAIISPDTPIERAVHISKSPFEQLIDARDYLIGVDGEPAGVLSSSFAQYLLSVGHTDAEVIGLADHPVCLRLRADGAAREENLLEAGEGMDYPRAADLVASIRAQFVYV